MIREAFTGARRPLLGATVCALLGFAGVAVGFLVDRKQALFSFLTAYAYALSIVLGALIFLAIMHVWKASWHIVLRRLIEGIVGTMPIFAVLFIPIVVGMADLYPWVTPETVTDEHLAHLLHLKAPYLNVPFFLIRAGVYLACWIGLSQLLRAWSLRQDREPGELAMARTVSAAALPILGLTLTFASFDWLMSLTPAWYSTAYGVYWFAGGFVAFLSLLAVMTHLGESSKVLEGGVSHGHHHAIGRLMMAFVVFWAYIALFQGFIIWITNKPEEVVWYIPRIKAGWGALLVVLIFGHFALPFVLLLSKRLKYRGEVLAAIGSWILAMHYLDVHWLIMPVLHPGGFRPHWLDACALLGVVGSTVAVALVRLRNHPLIPVGDPRLEASTHYKSGPFTW